MFRSCTLYSILRSFWHCVRFPRRRGRARSHGVAGGNFSGVKISDGQTARLLHLHKRRDRALTLFARIKQRDVRPHHVSRTITRTELYRIEFVFVCLRNASRLDKLPGNERCLRKARSDES